ncbi:MAG: M20 family metallopeptidase [Planctomycetaceae bacterium]
MDILAIRDAVAALEPAYLEALRELVDIDSGTYTPAGVNAVADRCEGRFRAAGWAVERTPHEQADGVSRLGDLLVGRLRGTGTTRVLLVGHMDTVFDEGTAAERPFRIEGTTATGPGVSDMKSGLLAGFFAVEALQAAGFDGFGELTYVCNPDEEIGSPFSRATIAALAAEHDVAFVLEGARRNGDIVSARKGVTDYELIVRGRAAHAGVEPEQGRSAILQAAHTVIALQGLNGRWPGVTVNVGVIDGGTRTNVVPAVCRLEVDLRAPALATLEEAEREIERICDERVVPDVEVEVHANGWHRPMEKGEGTRRLVGLAQEIAGELGIELRDAATGGASDANTTSAAGTPTLDGLGPVGGDDHAPTEWLDLASVVPRVTLLAGLIARA